MCTEKWRILLKEFKKAKHQDRGSGSAKMSYYKEIEEILRERTKNAYKSPTPTPKADSFMHFADKGFDDTGISFGPVEANGRPTLNLERRLDHDGHPLAITTADAVANSGVPPWSWRAEMKILNSMNIHSIYRLLIFFHVLFGRWETVGHTEPWMQRGD